MTAAAAVAEADNSSGRNSTSSRVVAPSASTAPPAAAPAVLAFRYGSVLLELLGGVLGCAGHLQEAFGVEVQHLMRVPQVCVCAGGGVVVWVTLTFVRMCEASAEAGCVCGAVSCPCPVHHLGGGQAGSCCTGQQQRRVGRAQR